MAQVRLESAAKSYGNVVALEGLDLAIQEGEFLSLLGPSGCGKTTTLRLIAGFLEPTVGRILIDGEDVTNLPPQKRRIGMVFQDYALFPHLSVEENVGFGLRERSVAKAKISARVKELLELIRLPGIEDRYPGELSGGQRQRVAVARAVAFPPRVLLMDEPLGALDLKLRENMQIELRRLQRELGITTVYVTHDQTEAMTMSDRIAVMNRGRLIQLDEPTQVYRRPKTRFVADFVGKINLIPGRIVGEEGGWLQVDAAGSRIWVRPVEARPSRAEITLAIRPEHLKLMPSEAMAKGMSVVSGQVTEETFTGNLTQVIARVANGSTMMVECRPEDDLPASGEMVNIAWKPERAVILED